MKTSDQARVLFLQGTLSEDDSGFVTQYMDLFDRGWPGRRLQNLQKGF